MDGDVPFGHLDFFSLPKALEGQGAAAFYAQERFTYCNECLLIGERMSFIGGSWEDEQREGEGPAEGDSECAAAQVEHDEKQQSSRVKKEKK